MKRNFAQYLSSFSWSGIILSLVLSFLFPKIGEKYLAPYVAYFLMLLLFLGSLELRFRKLLENTKDIRTVFFALGIIHLATVVPVFLLKKIFVFEIYLGLILIGSTATGMSNVFFAQLLGGDVSLALVLVAFSNLLSPLLVPLLLKIFSGKSIEIPFLPIFLSMAKLVLIPLLFARGMDYLGLKSFFKKLTPYLSFLGMTLLVYGVVSPLVSTIALYPSETLVISIFAIFFISFSYFFGRILGKSQKERITLGLSCSFKNFTMAIVIAQSFFGPLTVLPAIVYSVISNFLLAPLQIYYLRKR